MTLYDKRWKLGDIVAVYVPTVGEHFEPTVQRMRRSPRPFAHLRLAKGSNPSTQLIAEAADMVYGLKAVASRDKIELSYNGSVSSEAEAEKLIDAFVYEYNEAAERRKRRISASQAKLQSRNRKYVNHPQ